MKDYRMTFECSCGELADFMENEILHVDFCDLTHWFCSFDKAGGDTPDLCVIYRGVYNPNTVYVELDLGRCGFDAAQLENRYSRFLDFEFKGGKNWKLLDFSAKKID